MLISWGSRLKHRQAPVLLQQYWLCDRCIDARDLKCDLWYMNNNDHFRPYHRGYIRRASGKAYSLGWHIDFKEIFLVPWFVITDSLSVLWLCCDRCRASVAIDEFRLDPVSEVSELEHQTIPLESMSYQVLILGPMLRKSGVLVSKYPPTSIQNCWNSCT